MHPIIFPNNEGGSPQEIKDYILETCNKHKNEERALAFAFIISDLENPHVNKILRDTDYLKSLHVISGQFLTVFFLHDAYAKKTISKAKESTLVRIELSVQPINAIPNIRPKDLANVLIDDEILSTPSILFFQVDNGIITDYFVTSLKANEIQNGFNEIKEIIKVAVDSFSNVENENKQNSEALFKLLKSILEYSEFWKRAKRNYDKFIKFKDFIFFWK